MTIRTLLIPAIAAAGLASLGALAAQPGRVVIEPVQVTFERDWLARVNEPRGRVPSLREDDARRLANDYAASLQQALEAALRARGFEVVPHPAPDALRISARIDELYINAPDAPSTSLTQSYVRDAGRATLRAEGRDASGAVRIQDEWRATAGDTGRLMRASDVSNRYWFDALFRNWAREVATKLDDRAAR